MATPNTSEALRPFLKAVTTVADAELQMGLPDWPADAVARWRLFTTAVRPGDRVWFFQHFTPPRAGIGGYVIERDGMLCEAIGTERY